MTKHEQELKKMIEEKRPGSIPLYLVIRGSHAYGTNTPASDIDFAGVFMQPMNDILGFNYVEQINDDKNDIVIYEIKRFLQLLQSNNPTVLELLNTPPDCIIYKDPIFDRVLENSDKFITKICANSFGGYTKQQVGKAKGQDKKQNWEKDRVERKTPLDFCYVHFHEHSKPLKDYLEERGMNQDKCGLSRIPHAKDVFAMFYDPDKISAFHGIAFENSNDIRLSSIPSGYSDCFVAHVSYNKDAYSQHCKDFNEYQEWLTKRNEQRWVDVKSHGQKIDGKNMMHCVRLNQMSREIAEGKGIIVRRPNAEELLAIRRGEVDLQTIIDNVENEMKEIDRLFKESNLPDSVDQDFVDKLLVEIRKLIYFK